MANSYLRNIHTRNIITEKVIFHNLYMSKYEKECQRMSKNVDYKIISKGLASRVKKVLPNSISPQQMAYVKNWFIGESGRLIPDITEVTDILKKEGFLVTMDIEKTFDSLDHTFFSSVLKKFGFRNNFVSWIETLISKQESCVISGGNTT